MSFGVTPAAPPGGLPGRLVRWKKCIKDGSHGKKLEKWMWKERVRRRMDIKRWKLKVKEGNGEIKKWGIREVANGRSERNKARRL